MNTKRSYKVRQAGFEVSIFVIEGSPFPLPASSLSTPSFVPIFPTLIPLSTLGVCMYIFMDARCLPAFSSCKDSDSTISRRDSDPPVILFLTVLFFLDAPNNYYNKYSSSHIICHHPTIVLFTWSNSMQILMIPCHH